MTTSLIRPPSRNPYSTPRPRGLNSAGALNFRQDWIRFGKCRDVDPDALFVRGAAQRRAALVCEDCPVRLQCRVEAMNSRIEFGVWGGLTERQRRALLRSHPEFTDWTEYFLSLAELEAAEAAGEQAAGAKLRSHQA